MKLSLSEVVALSGNLKATPFKGASVIDAAINLVNLSEPLKIVEEIKSQLLLKHNKGSSKFEKSDSPELTSFLEDFNAALEKQVEVKDMKVILLTAVDSDRLNNHEALSELIKKNIINIP